MVERSRLAAVSLFVAGLTVGYFATAYAALGHGDPDHDEYWFGYQNCQTYAAPCAADNLEHTFCFGSDFDGEQLRDAARYAMRNLAEETKFTKNFVSDCTASTDVVWQRENLPGAFGRYRCVSTAGVSGPPCQKATVELDPAALNNASHPELQRNKTSCHEVGHSGGLKHSGGANDCMVSGPISGGHQHYNEHHEFHLNQN